MKPETADRRLRVALIGLESRTQALFVYGTLALFVGVLMAVGGAPAPVEAHFGPMIRLELGSPLAVGGALTVIGSFVASEKRWAWCSAFLGMSILMLWCLCMSAAYTVAGIEQGFAIAGPTSRIDPEAARAFVPFLYQGLMVLAGIHVVTFLRMGRPPR